MRPASEVERLKDVIGTIVDTLTKYGTEEEVSTYSFAYLCNVVDVLNWVLGDIPTESFLSPDFLDLESWLRRERELMDDFL